MVVTSHFRPSKKKAAAKRTPRKDPREKKAERAIKRAGDKVLAGKGAKEVQKEIDKAKPTPESDHARMVQARAQVDLIARLSNQLDAAKSHYGEVKKAHESAMLELVRIVREPLQLGLFDGPAPKNGSAKKGKGAKPKGGKPAAEPAPVGVDTGTGELVFDKDAVPGEPDPAARSGSESGDRAASELDEGDLS